MTGREKFGILSKLARERVRKEPERGSGPNLENDTEERNAQEERSRGDADRKRNLRRGSGREAGDAAKDSEFRRVLAGLRELRRERVRARDRGKGRED